MAAVGCNDCVWKFFDVPLVTEWSKTFGEWSAFLKNPFRTVAPVDLIKMNHGGDDGVGAWSALSFFGGIGYAILALILNIALWNMVVDNATAELGGAAAAAMAAATPMPIGRFIMNFITQLICVLIVAHIGWFSIVKRPPVAKEEGGAAESLPCCCLIFACVSCKCVPLAWAVSVWIIAVILIIQPLQSIGLCDACFLMIVPPLIYAFFLVFLGISAFKIWKEVFKGEAAQVVVGPAVATGGGAQTKGAPTLIGHAAAATKDPEKKTTADMKDLEKGTIAPAKNHIIVASVESAGDPVVVEGSEKKIMCGC